jgi:hypothetical protein
MGLGAFFPRGVFVGAERDALKRGWPIFIIRLTRATHFFTLFGQTLVTLALFTGHRRLTVVAVVIEIVVAILYYGITLRKPSLLSYDDPTFVRKVTRLYPPTDQHIIVWLVLLWQHLFIPLLLWLGGEPFEHHARDTVMCLLVFTLFSMWNYFCYLVQGVFAYPIQAHLMSQGRYLIAWFGCFCLVGMVGMVCDYMY